MNIFKLSLPGHDAKDARLKEEVVDSAYPSPKVDTLAIPRHSGIIFLNWESSGITVGNGVTKLIYSFPHGYNYVPTVIASHAFSNGSVSIHGTLPLQLGGMGMLTIDADNTNINLKYISFDLASTPIVPFTMRIRFYVFAEKGF